MADADGLHARQPLSKSIEIDDAGDIATIYGTKIAGSLLRVLGEPTPPGQWFRVIKLENGVATVQSKYEPEEGDPNA